MKPDMAPTEARVPGINLDTESENVIDAPESVKAGKDFQVKISSVGGVASVKAMPVSLLARILRRSLSTILQQQLIALRRAP